MKLSSERKTLIYAPYVEYIRDFRMSLEKSQTEISQSAGFSPKYLAMIESGARIPSLETLLILMQKLGVKRNIAEHLMQDVLNQYWGPP